MDHMTVSELARRTSTTPDTIRYYERIEILPEAERSPGGYRLFGEDDVERLRFVRRAQGFGLRLDEIRELLRIRDRGLCPCGHADDMLREKLTDLEAQINELDRLRGEIGALLDRDPVGGERWPCGGQLIQLTTSDDRSRP
jgi:DNA-binding transcriptional MerR regulator